MSYPLRACATILALLAACPALATFHLWQMTELYTNCDGTIQFVEFVTPVGSQQFVGGHPLTSTQAGTGTTQTFTLPAANLPGDSTNKRFLIGTAGFAALGIAAPDYVMPDNFLYANGGTLNWAGFDMWPYPAPPSDGSLSLNRDGSTGVNSPQNFAGQSGVASGARPPGAPQNLAAVAGDGQASFFFDAPASGGCSPVTSYAVTCAPGNVTVAGHGVPLTIYGLANATAYSCSAAAVNAKGTGSASAAIPATPGANPLALVAVTSRKAQGAAGDYDHPIDATRPIGDAALSVEPRNGPSHDIVFLFNAPISATGTASAVDSATPTPNPIAASAVASGSEVIVTLSGVADNIRVAVTLAGVNGTGLNVSAALGFLVGDGNNSHNVSAADILAEKFRSGASVDTANFRFDLNANGAISAADILAAKFRSGTTLPP